MKRSFSKVKWSLLGLVVLGISMVSGIGAQEQPTGDEILQRVAERGTFVREGGQISLVQFDLLFSDGTTADRRFAFFAKRDPNGDEKLLIYFLEPELECGTIFLSIDPADPDEESRLWMFMPGLNRIKELVSEEDRNASFAGSNLQRDQIGGGFDLSEDYRGTLLGEEDVEVNWLGETQARRAYKVALEARPEAEVDFPTGTVWVEKEEFLALRAEFNNAAGTLEQINVIDEFVEFEDEIVPNLIVVENVLDGSKTTIVILSREKRDLPDEIFDYRNLGDFNPEDFGIDSPCVP